MLKTIFVDDRRPFINMAGELMLPDNLLWGGQVEPKLKPEEWSLLLLLSIQGNIPLAIFQAFVGEINTDEVEAELRNKGFLE